MARSSGSKSAGVRKKDKAEESRQKASKVRDQSGPGKGAKVHEFPASKEQFWAEKREPKPPRG